MDNQEIARVLREMGEYIQMEEGLSFRARAYQKASDAVVGLSYIAREAYERGGMDAFLEIPGVGKGIAEVIGELITKGRSREYERLKKVMPVDVSELTAIGGLGPQKISALYKALGVTTRASLEKAARAGKISGLPGFGARSEEKIIKAIEFLKTAGGRFLLGDALPIARSLEERLAQFPGVERAVAAGSLRRRKETVGDLDILVVARNSEKVMAFFVHLPEVLDVIAHGETKSAVHFKNGLRVDLRVVKPESYGAALSYFTGSKEHNIVLRQIAQSKELKLNEYGLFRGKKYSVGKTEEDIYAGLGLPYIEPELREASGEIEAAQQGTLPRLIGYSDLQGDLQVQTTWSDGTGSIEEMARAAMRVGLEYMAVTDHTKRLAMTNGLDEKRIIDQMKEIDHINAKFKDQKLKFRILKGTECDILKDGTMDLPDAILARLDVVGGAVHSYFNLSRAEQTARMVKAMHNPHVDIIFHPTGRKINQRPAYDVDMEAIIMTAKETGTVLEIDAFPDRLDLKDDYIRLCVQSGVKMAIDSDAHDKSHFSVLEYGIAEARRGWASREDIINAWGADKMLSLLKHGESKLH